MDSIRLAESIHLATRKRLITGCNVDDFLTQYTLVHDYFHNRIDEWVAFTDDLDISRVNYAIKYIALAHYTLQSKKACLLSTHTGYTAQDYTHAYGWVRIQGYSDNDSFLPSIYEFRQPVRRGFDYTEIRLRHKELVQLPYKECLLINCT